MFFSKEKREEREEREWRKSRKKRRRRRKINAFLQGFGALFLTVSVFLFLNGIPGTGLVLLLIGFFLVAMTVP